jgi:hypothetical protein
MLIIQVFVAIFFQVGNFSPPSFLCQKRLDTKNGVLEAVMTVDTVRVHNQVAVLDVPPTVSITNAGDVPGGGHSSGDELAEFNGLRHR